MSGRKLSIHLPGPTPDQVEYVRKLAAASVTNPNDPRLDARVGPAPKPTYAELETENTRLKADLAFCGEHIMDLECEATRRNAQVERLRAALSAVVHPSLVDAIARGDASNPTPMLSDGNGQA